jgi:hypothetical protein
MRLFARCMFELCITNRVLAVSAVTIYDTVVNLRTLTSSYLSSLIPSSLLFCLLPPLHTLSLSLLSLPLVSSPLHIRPSPYPLPLPLSLSLSPGIPMTGVRNNRLSYGALSSGSHVSVGRRYKMRHRLHWILCGWYLTVVGGDLKRWCRRATTGASHGKGRGACRSLVSSTLNQVRGGGNGGYNVYYD